MAANITAICRTSISYDITAGLSPSHQTLPPPGFTVGIELPSTIWWPPGHPFNTHSLTETVKHKGVSIMLDGHDLGPAVLNITIPSTFWLAAVHLKASRKVNFAASTVKMDNKPVGCTGPLFPMQSCGEPVDTPLSWNVTQYFFDSVKVGLTAGDVIAGWVTVGANLIIDLIAWGGEKPGKADKVINSFFLSFFPFPLTKKEFYTMIAKSVVGLVVSGFRGDPTFKFGKGTAFAGWQLQLGYDFNEGGKGLHSGVEGNFLFWKRGKGDFEGASDFGSPL